MKISYILLALFFLGSFSCKDKNESHEEEIGITLLAPQNETVVDLSNNKDIEFFWSETETSVSQGYSLFIDSDINFSSSAMIKYEVTGIKYAISSCEMENLLKSFGVSGGTSQNVYWTVVHANQSPSQATSIYSFEVQRISFDISLQLPEDSMFVNLMEDTELEFEWDEKGVITDPSYYLWIDIDKYFNSDVVKNFSTTDKFYSFSWDEFDGIMNDLDIEEGQEATVYWTISREENISNLICDSEIRSITVQRVSENIDVGYRPVKIYDYEGPTFYVDSENGSDDNTGTSESSAWKTLEKVNSYNFTAGDVIRFKSGGLWRGQLKPKSGMLDNPIVYTSYGTGPKPILQVSIARNNTADWKEVSTGMWVASTGNNLDIGNIIFNHGEDCGVKKPSLNTLSQNGDYFSDKEHEKLYLKFANNPASVYESIELAPKLHGVDLVTPAVSFVTFDDLAVRYTGAHGFALCNNRNVIIRRCDVYWIGGSYQVDPPNPIRYGNAIEYWIGASNMLVENNRIWEVYDAGVTNQGSGTTSIQQNITYRNNLIWNCEMSFEYWHRPASSTTRNILFENNTCINAGYGWGYNQRPDKNGTHLNFYSTSAKVSDFTVRNNVFVNAKNGTLRMDNQWPTAPYINHNLYYEDNDGFVGFVLFKRYRDLDEMKSAAPFESHSIFENPNFENPAKHDYRMVSERTMTNGIMPGITEWDSKWEIYY